MGRHLILSGVDQRLIKRIRRRAAALALGPGELVRALLTEQLGERAAPANRVKRRKPFKA